MHTSAAYFDGPGALAPTAGKSAVSIRRISKTFRQQTGEDLTVLDGISFDATEGSITSILGPSGCGKSTLLHIISGLTRSDEGEILLLGQQPEPLRAARQLSYVFQEDRLLPWRTATQNVALGLEAADVASSDRRARVAEALEVVGLGGFEGAFPHQLSGGMRSRVALARSLVLNPKILLMDEPFGRLDAQTRSSMHDELLKLWRTFGMSILFVTHDVEEAVVLADRVVVLAPRPGRIREIVDVDFPRPRIPTEAHVGGLIQHLHQLLKEPATQERQAS